MVRSKNGTEIPLIKMIRNIQLFTYGVIKWSIFSRLLSGRNVSVSLTGTDMKMALLVCKTQKLWMFAHLTEVG